jgi:hypothetical protein
MWSFHFKKMHENSISFENNKKYKVTNIKKKMTHSNAANIIRHLEQEYTINDAFDSDGSEYESSDEENSSKEIDIWTKDESYDDPLAQNIDFDIKCEMSVKKYKDGRKMREENYRDHMKNNGSILHTLFELTNGWNDVDFDQANAQIFCTTNLGEQQSQHSKKKSQKTNRKKTTLKSKKKANTSKKTKKTKKKE